MVVVRTVRIRVRVKDSVSVNRVKVRTGTENNACHLHLMSCLVLQNNQQSSSWSITLMVVVGHGMRTGAHLDS